MTADVDGGVLPLAVGMIGGWPGNLGSREPGLFVVCPGIGHAQHDRVTSPIHRARHAARHHHCAIIECELRTMLADPQLLDKAEGAAEPCHRSAHVGIGQHRNDDIDGIERFLAGLISVTLEVLDFTLMLLGRRTAS